jgi:DNA-binding beta-propeller fold protein YncE
MEKLNNKHLSCLILIYCVLSFRCNSQGLNNNIEKEKLTLVSKISLPNVTGRIDHISYDTINQLAFIAALSNNSVEVVDVKAKRAVRSIPGLHEPQGVVYIPSSRKLVIANGDNGDCLFFDVATYKQLGAVHLKSDADNMRFDSASQLLYVGYGSGAIAIIDANSMKLVGEIPLDGHPESFQLSKKQNRIYINVPDADEIEVADIATKKVTLKWQNKGASSNFPMALDEENNRLFIGYRSPAKLRMINTQAGEEIITVHCSDDADDVFYDTKDSLVFVSAGKGFIDVYRVNGKDLVQINHIQTSRGARTSLLLNTERKFLLAVPAQNGVPAALWIYNID